MRGADQEVELKFVCRPDDVPAVLGAAPAGEDNERELLSVYFDTPRHDLRKLGVSLRVREAGGERIQTFKRGDGLVREEYETAVEGETPDLTQPLFQALLPDEAREALRPAFNVRVRRRQRLVRYRGAEIELAVDMGAIAAEGRSHDICEVELELKSGEPEALFALGRELAQAAPLYLSFDGKAAQGEALVDDALLEPRKSEAVSLAADATVAQAFQAIARGGLAQMAANAALLRETGRSDALHQVRVAARRLRSVFATFTRAIDDPRLGDFQAEFKWAAKACDAARDLDVFIQDGFRPAAEETPRLPGLLAFGEALGRAREAAQVQAREALSSDRFRALVLDAAEWIELGAWRDEPGAQAPAAELAAEALEKRRRKALQGGRRLARLSDDQRHDVRIEAKKLRYALEAFAPLYPEGEVKPFVAALKGLQDQLGALNDAAVAGDLAFRVGATGPALFAAGHIAGRKAAGKRDLVRKAGKAIRKLERAESFWRQKHT